MLKQTVEISASGQNYNIEKTSGEKRAPMTDDISKLTDSMEELLLQRHRKERKELQSKVQCLKKTSTKGDKKKKKEILEEIVAMEVELENRQSEELLNFQENNVSEVQVNDIASNVEVIVLENSVEDKIPHFPHRTSKAQKRRDKKATQAKSREETIKAQEIENIHGVRNVETQKIKQILKDRSLMIHEISSDGNCLYCAIDYQLNHKKMGLDKLRSLTSKFLREHSNDFLPFLSHPDTGNILTLEQFEDYCNKVENTPAWGGEVELRALSHVLKCPIEIIQASGPSIVVGEEYKDEKRIILTYHRHMYGLGEHYNSVKPYEDSQEE